MTHQINIQLAVKGEFFPNKKLLTLWANSALEQSITDQEITIRLVDNAEMITLNETYRKKIGATNVLSFPNVAEPDMPEESLGDIVICAPYVNHEAKEQGKPLEAHWAHMVVHGVLHLLGYDHLDDAQAQQMEALEINILQRLGYQNPYEERNKAE